MRAIWIGALRSGKEQCWQPFHFCNNQFILIYIYVDKYLHFMSAMRNIINKV